MTSSTISRLGLSPQSGSKAPCVATSIVPGLTRQGLYTLNGVVLRSGDRVLDKDATPGTDRGIYVASIGVWKRAKDWDGDDDLLSGVIVYAPNVLYVVTFAGDFQLNVTVPTFVNVNTSIYPDLASTEIGKGAAMVGYIQGGTGSIARTVEEKLHEVVSVLDFGADPTGIADSTAAFNRATRATVAHGGNDDLSMRREIFVPPGDYLIAGTVYVRKGQTLRGAGCGVSRIVIPNTLTGNIAFKMGYGLISGVPTEDAGGLAPVICELHTIGGDGSGAVISATVAGQKIHDMFITSAGTGIVANGGDGLFYNVIFDGGLNGFIMQGQNQIVSNCLFYLLNYGVVFSSGNYDNQFVGCHFEYSQYNDFLFADGITDIHNVSIANCQFVKNAQYATSNAAINFRCSGANVAIHGCEFRNQRSYSIARTNGVGNVVRVSDCIFNGAKTNPAYTQSTTAAGIDTSNCIFDITNCSFENLFGSPINSGSVENYEVLVRGCKYKAISGAASFVVANGTTGSVRISNCEGDGVLPIVNTQSNVAISLKGNRRWLGAPGSSGGRLFWNIPTQGAAIVQCGISANPNPPGNLLYRKASNILAARHVDYNGSAVADFITKTVIYETPAGYVSVIDVQVDIDSVGGGASAVYANFGRNIVVSVPNTYNPVTFEADFITP